MMKKRKNIRPIAIGLLLLLSLTMVNAQARKTRPFVPKVVYRSDDLIITQVSDNAFEHTSFLQTEDFGKVPCNGLIVRDHNEAIVFDTPPDDKSAGALIGWITGTLRCKINAIVPTHFHNDCLGGLKAFDERDIPSYAYFETLALARENNTAVPKNGFRDSLILQVGERYVVARFFGRGHTKDNIVGYFPSEDLLFGGCLIKEIDAGKGYLGDADIAAWPRTVEKVKQAYPNVKIVVPGHGAYGNKELLDYTIRLFRPE